MHALLTTSILATASLLTLANAGPIRPPQHPYFAVEHFSFTKTSIASRYQFNVSFPQDVVLYPTDGADTSMTIPGFEEPVPCTGTYFYSPSETSTVTLINACGRIGDGTKANVTSKLDVEQGTLFLNYSYRDVVNGCETVYTWVGNQTHLNPVDASAMEGFNTPAYGPGVTN